MRWLSARVGPFGRFAIEHEITLERRGLVLVEGINLDGNGALDSNGACKSLLLEAIFAWNPFGKLPRYGNARLGADDVCVDDRPAVVETEIETSRGRFEILRVHRNGRATFNVKSWDEHQCGYVPVRGTSVDPNAYAEDSTRLLGFDYATLRHALFLQGSGFGVPVAGFSAQIKLLESVLRYDVFDRAADLNDKDAKLMSATVQATLDEIERLSAQAEHARMTIAELETLNETDREQMIRRSIEAIGARLITRASIEQGRSRHAKKVAKLDAEHADASAELRDIARTLTRYRDLSERAECPTCGEPVRVTAAMLEEAERKYSAMDAHASGVSDRLNEAQTNLVRVNGELLALDADVREHQHLQAELASLLERRARTHGLLTSHRERLASIEGQLGALTQQIAVGRLDARVRTDWKKRGIPDMKAETLSAAVPYLNERAAHYSNVFTGDPSFVHFDPFRASRNDDMLRLNGASARNYRGCSSGERRRIDIITALSLRALARWRLAQIGESVNVMLWDEVFDTLDESGLERAVSVLRQDLVDIETVFVVTHHPTLRALFPAAHTLRVIREHGIARVEDAE